MFWDRNCEDPTGWLPYDLATWIDPFALMALALNEARGTDCLPDERPLADQMPGMPSEVLLAVLTYCYARGVYRSNILVDRVQRDQAIVLIAGTIRMDGDNLKRIRQERRHLLKQILVRLFQLAWQHHFEASLTNDPAAPDRGRLPSSIRFGSELSRAFVCAAEDRIHRAIHCDQMDAFQRAVHRNLFGGCRLSRNLLPVTASRQSAANVPG